MHRKLRWMLALVLLGSLGYVAWPIPTRVLDPGPVVSLRILDRRGRLLREVLSDQQGRSRWVRLERLPPSVRLSTLAAEDRRFERHAGVDPVAIARAAGSNLRAGRIVSGGSTLTQQLASILLGTGRSLPGKLYESLYAMRLEVHLSKGEILEQVLNRTGYGNQCYGIEAAARLYFGRPAAALSLAQAAALAVLPRSPARYDPYRHPARLAAAQQRVLLRLRSLGWISDAALERALREDPGLVEPSRAFRAPHFCELVVARLRRRDLLKVREIRTTLDLDLQRDVEGRLRAHVAAVSARGISNAAAVILDNASGAVLALAGSADYFDPARDGMVNGASARRQPGSALKPFIYGLALARGQDLAERLPDFPLQAATAAGDYRPRNYDGRYHGWVSLRGALACSYNIPAVRLAEKLSPAAILGQLHAAGFESLSRPASHYGLGLALGGGEVTLLELARAYAGLARQGSLPPLLLWQQLLDHQGRPIGETAALPRRFLDRRSAFLITDVLSDPDARRAAFGSGGPLDLPFPCAAKTGTSEGFRDNWTVGYTPRFTVGVWAGNFDGRPMRSVSGISGAAPLFHDLMLLLWQRSDWVSPDFEPPPGLERRRLCSGSGLAATPDCPVTIEELFVAEAPPRRGCALHQAGRVARRGGRLAFAASESVQLAQAGAAPGLTAEPVASRVAIVAPRSGDVFALDPILRRKYQTLRLIAQAPAALARLQWRVDGELLAEVSPPFEARWPLAAGRHRIELVDPGVSARPVATLAPALATVEITVRE